MSSKLKHGPKMEGGGKGFMGRIGRIQAKVQLLINPLVMKKLLFLMLILSGCTKDDPGPSTANPPSIRTILEDVTSTGATIGVEAGGVVFEKGVQFDGDIISSTPGAGTETQTMTLEPLETYTVRAYARNSAGTVYGNQITFTANCESTITSVVPYSTTGMCSASGTVSFTEDGEGVYLLSDASFGVYDCEYGDTPSVGIKVINLCGELLIQGQDQYGVTYTWDVISNVGGQLTIEWESTLANGTTVLTGNFPWN